MMIALVDCVNAGREGTSQLAQGRILDSDPKWEEALVEPSIEFMGKHEVLVARLLVKPTSGKIPLKFVNVSDREIELHKNSLMGAMEEVSILRDDSLGVADIRLVDTPNKLITIVYRVQ